MANIDMKQFVRLVKDNFSDNEIKTIVEVGALDGEDSVYFKQCFPNAKVVAFEGLKENWEAVTPEGVAWLNVVIASYDGETTYHVKHTNGIHGIYDRGAIYGTEKRTVPCYRLDSIFDTTIDMMKIDVEGATYDVFEGMGSLLDTVKIMHIETEDVPYFAGQKKLHKEVYEFLLNRGFTCLRTEGARIQHGSQYDSVWIKK
jgi:FkbM family methyltransferase